MSLFRPKKVICPAGRWTVIISTLFAQMPQEWSVRFEGEAVGELEEKKSSWIFPGKPRRAPMNAPMTFTRGYWNTFYSVKVCPSKDVVAIVSGRRGRALKNESVHLVR